MKLHAFHFTPHGLVRAFSHWRAGRRLCRAAGRSMRGLIPDCVNSMTPAWNFHRTLVELGLPPPETMLDVGANLGQMTRLLAMACPRPPRLIAFEPNPALTPPGELFRLALSDADGEADLFLPPGESGWASIEPRNDAPMAGAHPVRVPCARLDTLIARGALDPKAWPHPVLAKVDTEGSEVRALRGFGDALRAVDYVVVEIGNAGELGRPPSALPDVCALLREAGFRHAKTLYAAYDGPNAPAYLDLFFWR
jgi:FkbM family methyltransferase